jgi:GntR family transcriptional regulator
LERALAPAAAAQALRLGPADQAIVLQRLRLANGEPLAVETACLPDALCHALLKEDLQDRSLYQVLSAHFGLSLAWAEQRVEAVVCPPAVAELLGVGKGTPVMHTTRTTYSHGGTPFEYTEAHYRGDKHFFYIELRNER